jgi:hypothetical protein
VGQLPGPCAGNPGTIGSDDSYRNDGYPAMLPKAALPTAGVPKEGRWKATYPVRDQEASLIPGRLLRNSTTHKLL